MRLQLSPPLLALFLLLALGVLGLFIVDDYGISWDEAIQRGHGRVSMDYALEKLNLDRPKLAPQHDLENYQWANYGMIYQLAATALELELGLEDDPYAYYRLRHLMNFGLYLAALVFFHASLRLRWPEQPWYPLIGTLLLVMSPRIFGHAFFNPKDHILLVFYLIGTYTLLRLLRYRTWSSLLLHALATALALNTRLPALLLLGATVALLLWEWGFYRPTTGRRNLAMAAAYPVLSIGLMIPFFPYLWADTLPRLWNAFSEMADFDWGGINLLFGEIMTAKDLPAYYIPAWILATTPVVYLCFILSGLGLTLWRALPEWRTGRLWRNFAELTDLTQLGLSVGPMLVVIVLHATLYNGWRHLHFVYPGLIFLAMTGFDYWRRRYVRLTPWVLAAGMAVTSLFMVCGHPHQYVYFNELIHGEPIMARFDMDYWGVGFRDAFVQLAKTVPEGETRTVNCSVWPCTDNLLSLPPPYRSRLRRESNAKKADYRATNFIGENKKAALYHQGVFRRPMVEITPCGHLSIGVYGLKIPD